MSDLFGGSSDSSLGVSGEKDAVDSELQQFLLVEREKAKLQAQVSFTAVWIIHGFGVASCVSHQWAISFDSIKNLLSCNRFNHFS